MADERRLRIENALWGLFVGDALAMPAHWFYSTENITKQWGPKGVQGFEPPPHPHPEAFMIGMAYSPDVESCKHNKRKYDILGENAKFYRTTYTTFDLDTSHVDPMHGNKTTAAGVRYHYHSGLGRGDLTTGGQLCRVLLRSVGKAGCYDEGVFLDDFVESMTTPGVIKDPYKEVYLRRWFESYSKGTDVRACAHNQRDIWSIGSTGGMLRPLILSLLAGSDAQGVGVAIEHQNLTHRSLNVSAALSVAVPLLRAVVNGANVQDAVVGAGKQVHMPKVTGAELKARYREAKGPNNIPKDECWRLHTDLRDEPMDLVALAQLPEEEFVNKVIGTECYTEHTFPLTLYLAAKYRGDCKSALLANVNSGGDSVHRGMMLGLIMGGADGRVQELAKELSDYEELKKEIAAFADLAVSGKNPLCA